MIMTPGLRKLALTAHITSSVGLLGAVAGFLALAVAGLTSQNAQVVRAAYPAMEVIAWFVVLPLTFAALLTGTIQALGTTWGLFRYYWILAKLLLTVLTVIVLLVQLKPIGLAAAAAAGTMSGSEFGGLQVRLLLHAAGGLLVLLAAATLAVYKPWGVTRYGARART